MAAKKKIIKRFIISSLFLALASPSVSMASWSHNGVGGTFTLSGVLIPKDAVTPWEVMLGHGVRDINVEITKGQQFVSFPLKEKAAVLGIRTVDAEFDNYHQQNITPTIDYNGAVTFDSNGLGHVSLDAMNPAGQKIGKLTVDKFVTVGKLRYRTMGDEGETGASEYLYAEQSGDVFYGGLPSEEFPIESAESYKNIVQGIMPEVTEHFDDSGLVAEDTAETMCLAAVADRHAAISAFYGAAIPDDSFLSLNLDSPVKTDDELQWHADWGITISYM